MVDVGGGGGPHLTTPTALHAAEACWPPLGAGPSTTPPRADLRGQAIFNPTAVGNPDRAPAVAAGSCSSETCAGGAQGRPAFDANAAADPSASAGAPTRAAVAARPPAALASRPDPSPAGAPPTFAQVLLQNFEPKTAPFPVHPPARTDGGEPAAFFTQEEISWSCRPLQTAVIARTPQGRPPFTEIRAHLTQRFKFQRDFVISSLDRRHLLIRFQENEDFLQVLLKGSMLVQGRPFKFFRWSVDFCPEMDSPVVPVWMELPQLPANFFTESMVRSIVGSLGPVLKIDRNTLNLSCTQAARANVQLDVSKALPVRIWIGCGPNGFWQPINYPDPPPYCSACRRLGHLVAACKRVPSHSNRGPDGTGPEQTAPKASRVAEHGKKELERMQWRPLSLKNVTSAPSKDQQRPTPAKEEAASNAHHLFAAMPVQPPPTESAKGLIPEDKGGVLHPSPAIIPQDSGHDSHIVQGWLHGGHAQPPSIADDPTTAGPSHSSEYALRTEMDNVISSQESPSNVPYNPIAVGGESNEAQADCSSPAPLLPDGLQVFDEMTRLGSLAARAAAPTSLVAVHTSAPHGDDGRPHLSPIPVSLLDESETHEVQPTATPVHMIPGATTQQQGAPFAAKVRDISPSILNAAAPPWTTPQRSVQSSLAHKGAAPMCSPSGVETSASPSAPRLSFLEALRKKTKQRDICMKTANLPPPSHPTVAPLIPGSKRPPSGHVIGLPAPNTIGGIPVPAKSSDSEEDDPPILHNAWAGRTRQTTVLNMDSDGEYEDSSEGDFM